MGSVRNSWKKLKGIVGHASEKKLLVLLKKHLSVIKWGSSGMLSWAKIGGFNLNGDNESKKFSVSRTMNI